MASFAKITAKITSGLMPSVLLVAFGVLASGDLAWACEGTLCDLVGSNNPTPSASAQPAAPTPLTVPSTGGILGFFKSKPAADNGTVSSQSGANPLLSVQGGGLASALSGQTSNQRCTGTFCDFFYRGAPSEPAAQQAATAQQPATRLPAGAPAPSPNTAKYKTVVEAVELPHEKPLCHSATDPWHCFR